MKTGTKINSEYMESSEDFSAALVFEEYINTSCESLVDEYEEFIREDEHSENDIVYKEIHTEGKAYYATIFEGPSRLTVALTRVELTPMHLQAMITSGIPYMVIAMAVIPYNKTSKAA